MELSNVGLITSPVVGTRGTAGLAGELPHAFQSISGRGKPVAMVALGNRTMAVMGSDQLRDRVAELAREVGTTPRVRGESLRD